MKSATIVLFSVLLFFFLQSSTSAYASGKIWACGKTLSHSLSKVCSPEVLRATIMVRLHRIRNKYNKGRYGKGRRSVSAMMKTRKEMDNLYSNNRSAIQRHGSSRNVGRRLQKRGITTDCCMRPCRIEYIQARYCGSHINDLMQRSGRH